MHFKPQPKTVLQNVTPGWQIDVEIKKQNTKIFDDL